MEILENIFWPFLIICFSGFVIWRATDGFELASNYLGRNLDKGIKGATINAIASSMPEFLATFFFLFYIREANSFSGGIGITGGSAVFNILIIPVSIYFAVTITQNGKRIPVNRKIILRDGLVLIAMTGLMTIIIKQERLDYRHGLILTIPYLLYIGGLYYNINDSRDKASFFHHANSPKKRSVRDFILIDLERVILRNRPVGKINAWALLAVSIVVMVFGTWALVYGTDELGKNLNIPLIFVSVILASAASSLPDTMISVRDAQKGNYEDAFSNAIGSNLFNISFALGFPLLLYTLIYDPVTMDPVIIETSTDLWMFLLTITVITITILASGKNLTAPKVWIMIFLYAAFIAFIIIEMVLKVDTFQYIFKFYHNLT